MFSLRVKFPTYKGLSARFFHKQKSKGCQQRERERDWGEGEQKGRKRKYVHLDYKGANMHDFAIYIL